MEGKSKWGIYEDEKSFETTAVIKSADIITEAKKKGLFNSLWLYFKLVLTCSLLFGSILPKDISVYRHVEGEVLHNVDAYWQILRVLVPFHIVHQACTAAHPRLFLSPPSHTCHLPLQPNSSSLILLISAARRMMTSAWWGLFTPLLHPLLSPTVFTGNSFFFFFLSSMVPSVQPPERLCPFVFWTLECDRVQILVREATEGE